MASERLNELFSGSLENIEATTTELKVEAERPATVADACALRRCAADLAVAAEAFANKLASSEPVLAEEPHTDE